MTGCTLWACVRYPRMSEAFGHTAAGHRTLLRVVRLLTEVNSVEKEPTVILRFLAMRPDAVLRIPQAGPAAVRSVEAAQWLLRGRTEDEYDVPARLGV